MDRLSRLPNEILLRLFRLYLPVTDALNLSSVNVALRSFRDVDSIWEAKLAWKEQVGLDCCWRQCRIKLLMYKFKLSWLESFATIMRLIWAHPHRGFMSNRRNVVRPHDPDFSVRDVFLSSECVIYVNDDLDYQLWTVNPFTLDINFGNRHNLVDGVGLKEFKIIGITGSNIILMDKVEKRVRIQPAGMTPDQAKIVELEEKPLLVQVVEEWGFYAVFAPDCQSGGTLKIYQNLDLSLNEIRCHVVQFPPPKEGFRFLWQHFNTIVGTSQLHYFCLGPKTKKDVFFVDVRFDQQNNFVIEINMAGNMSKAKLDQLVTHINGDFLSDFLCLHWNPDFSPSTRELCGRWMDGLPYAHRNIRPIYVPGKFNPMRFSHNLPLKTDSPRQDHRHGKKRFYHIYCSPGSADFIWEKEMDRVVPHEIVVRTTFIGIINVETKTVEVIHLLRSK